MTSVGVIKRVPMRTSVNEMMIWKRLLGATILLVTIVSMAKAQDQRYSKNGLTFEFPEQWTVSEKPSKDAQEISVSNKEADAQITVLAIRKEIDGKDAMAEAHKRIIEPWLKSLIDQYTLVAKINLERTDIKTAAGGMAVDGVELKFQLDGQGGRVEACWVMFERRLLLLYIIRPDSAAEKANIGWEKVRESIRSAGKK